MVKVTPIVAAQYPQLKLRMESGVGPQIVLKTPGHFAELSVGEDPIETAVKPPDELFLANGLKQKHAQAVNRARPELGFYHHHRSISFWK
jgi:hypothetical protein